MNSLAYAPSRVASPAPAGLPKPLAAVLAEQNDEWTEARRYMGPEILAACRKAGQPDMEKDNINETGVTIEAISA